MSNADTGNSGSAAAATRHKAGAFDIRTIIAGLIGFYGVVLIIAGLVDNGAAAQRKTGDVNANLWTGIVMALVAVAFVVWARLRPVVVDPGAVADDDRPA